MSLAADRGQEGAPLLVLLHGLGATREVWRPMLRHAEGRWPGRWLAMDLPGHGRSPPSSDYSPMVQAAAVAQAILAERADAPVWVLGHSLGGVIGLALASGEFGSTPARVFALGVKTSWSEPELAKLSERASAPRKVFADRNAAVELYSKVSGLAGLAAASGPVAEAGIAPCDGGWRLAMDPKANSVGPPDMAGLVAAARAPIFLAAGELDPMCSLADMRTWDAGACLLPGLGHNAMVEDPAAVWAWVNALAKAA